MVFYKLAIDADQAFSEGTFVIQDTGWLFYNFLLDYVKDVNPSVKGTIGDPAVKFSGGMTAYPRLSSHFVLEQKSYRHYGIDFPRGLELPFKKHHILFGKIDDQDRLFIKLESAGLTSRDIARHGWEFAAAQVRKAAPAIDKFLVAMYLRMHPR